MTCLSLKVTETEGFSLADKILKSTAQPDFCWAGILARKRRTGFALAANGSNLTATLVKYLVIIVDSRLVEEFFHEVYQLRMYGCSGEVH